MKSDNRGTEGAFSTPAADDSLSRIISIVDKLAQGDPGVRMAAEECSGMTSGLCESINRLAESIEEMVGESHEMAIGLCEHYDALNRIAAGDFIVRAPVDSPNELIAKLGQLINKGADSMMAAIDELRRKDQELESARDKLRDIVEFLPDATFVIDRNKVIIAWNKALEAMTGIAKEEMLGKGDYAYAVPFYGHPRPVLIDFLGMEKEELSNRYTYVEYKGMSLFAETFIPFFHGGEGIYLWLTASPLLDASGELVGAIESIRDITNLKRSENENLRLLEQLRQSQKMEAIGQLAGGVAHDFNNILTAIIGYGQLIKFKAGDAVACRRYGEQIVQASVSASALTRDLLAFSRRQVLDFRVCDANQLITDMEEMLRRLIGEDIVMEVSPSTHPLMIKADVGQIQQVLMNLVANARDAMPDGGRIEIRLQACESRLNARLLITDTGCGMNEDVRKMIFEPFFTTKQVGKGTGLGLSIVFGIIAQHGGTIEVESELGAGTTFIVVLPLVESEAESGPAAPEHDQLDASVKEGTILLVEDNDITREVIQEILEEAGYRVVTAIDGEAAVLTYREMGETVDLVLLDVIMPRMNGRETLDAIIALGRPVRYLFMSGYTADIIHSKGRLDQGINFIAKPVIAGELLRKIAEIMKSPPVPGGGQA